MLRKYPFFKIQAHIIDGRDLLAMDRGGVSDPYIKCIHGQGKLFQSKPVPKTVNPTWDETFNLGIVHIPALSVVRVSVFDSKDSKKKSNNELLYQSTLPVDYLRSGFRCIRMRNKFGVFENGLAALLVYVNIDARADKLKQAKTASTGSKDLSTMMAEFSSLEKKRKSK